VIENFIKIKSEKVFEKRKRKIIIFSGIKAYLTLFRTRRGE